MNPLDHATARLPLYSTLALAAFALAGPTATSEEATVAARAQQVEPGFVSLFDGKSLTGWVTAGGRYDGNARWSVEDGCLVGRQGPAQAGGLIYTEGLYASYDLRLDVALDSPFDSGVFLRMVPDARGFQVTLDYRPDGEIGGIYSDGWLEHNAGAKEHFKTGWNELRIRSRGFDPRIEVWLNGDKITDYQHKAAAGFASTGRIGLQVHGARDDQGAARFRNLRLRELPMFGEERFTPLSEAPLSGLLRLSELAAGQGWSPLFNGRDLEGWTIQGESNRYEVENGVLAFRARGGGGELRSVAEYQDFRLRLEFKLSKMANSGVFLRASREEGTNPAFSGAEIQILDDHNWETVRGAKLKPWQFTGSLYGSVAPAFPKALRPIGEWNTLEVLYQGTRLAVALNGKPLYDVDTHALVPESGEPFERRVPRGFLGLQHHGADGIEADTMVWFRNAFVQTL